MLNRNALRQGYQISVNTGTENIRDYFSISYVEEEGLQKSTGFSRVTLKNNIELLSIAPWLKVGDNLLFSYNDYERIESTEISPWPPWLGGYPKRHLWEERNGSTT